MTNKQLMDKAMGEGFALGAFNVNNMELIQGITEAAKELNAPLILQVSKGARSYAGKNYIMNPLVVRVIVSIIVSVSALYPFLVNMYRHVEFWLNQEEN